MPVLAPRVKQLFGVVFGAINRHFSGVFLTEASATRLYHCPILIQYFPVPHVTAEILIPRLNETESNLSGRFAQPPIALGSEDKPQLGNIPLPIGEVALTAKRKYHSAMDIRFQREDPMSLLVLVHHFLGRLGYSFLSRLWHVKLTMIGNNEKTSVPIRLRRLRFKLGFNGDSQTVDFECFAHTIS